jgi:hypothetical protein
LEGGRALQWLPIREADDLIISLVDEPLLGGGERADAGSDLTKGRDVDFPTDGCVLDVGAVNRQARSGILCCSRSRVTARLHAIIFRPMASGARAAVHVDVI